MRPFNKLSAMTAILGALALQGCSVQTKNTQPPRPPPPVPHTDMVMALDASPSSKGMVNITPFSKMDQHFANTSEPSDRFPAAYTRLLITSRTAATDQGGESTSAASETLAYEQRGWFSRLLVGRHTSTNLTIKVSAGPFNATVPLITIDHVSTKSDGESFNRIVYHQAENYPLFLVKRDGSNGIVSVKSTVKISDQIQSGAAGAALEVAQGVLRQVAPQATILTTLNQQNAKNVATAIDTAVNKLFAASVDEEQWTDSDVRLWGKGVDLQFDIPRKEGVFDGKGEGATYHVGVWTIAFANPRPSVFSDIQVCPVTQSAATIRCKSSFKDAAEAVEAEVVPAEALAFDLVNGGSDLGSVSTYLKKQDWYATGTKAFAGKPTAAEAVDFCRALRSSIASLGLNEVDQGIIAHSVATAMPLPQAGVELLTKEPQCQCQYKKCTG